jgi:hypothetical protein
MISRRAPCRVPPACGGAAATRDLHLAVHQRGNEFVRLHVQRHLDDAVLVHRGTRRGRALRVRARCRWFRAVHAAVLFLRRHIGPSNTFLPSLMMTQRSHICSTSPSRWELSMMVMPWCLRRCRMSSRNSRMPSGSSPSVGSSSSRIFGCGSRACARRDAGACRGCRWRSSAGWRGEFHHVDHAFHLRLVPPAGERAEHAQILPAAEVVIKDWRPRKSHRSAGAPPRFFCTLRPPMRTSPCPGAPCRA